MLRWVEVYVDRLLSNYYKIKKLSLRKKIIAVVKADAYGHGSVKVSQTLQKFTDVSGFAVATYEEGRELREAGIEKPILVMASSLSEGKREAVELNLTPVVFDFEELKMAKELNVPFHVKVDTGMGRLGFLKEDWEKLLQELKDSKLSGVMTHFSSADEDEEFTKHQLRLFKEFVRKLRKDFPNVAVHADNSAALSLRLNSELTHCRVGLSLYGSKPHADFPLKLEQVMEVKAKVISVKELPSGFPVSYGRTYYTTHKEKVAVISFGYADGLPRSLSNRGVVVVGGKRLPIRGRVCMDMTVVSAEGADVRKGSVAVISGKELTFEELAELAGTIPYELMCEIGKRVVRLYRNA